MRRLVDGAYAVVSRGAMESQVRRVNHGRGVDVPAGLAEPLRRLAHGVPDGEPADELWSLLARAQVVVEGADPVDAVAEERLGDLGRGFAWHSAHDGRAPGLSDLLRRAHARRKLSYFALGQTACLPESGVARCLELERRAGKGRRVLLIGDDDLLGLALSRMGHDVTVWDIDHLLVGFLRRVAEEEGLALDARVQDVLQPLGQGALGAFDVVLTDPMSYEGCLKAFLSRAASAVREGGLILTCVHALARDLFRRVAWGLPVEVVDCLYELSAYYYEGYVENWYRSDLWVLRRGAGEPAWLPDEAIPLGNIIAGSLKDRAHGFTDVGALPFRKPSHEGVAAVLDGWARYFPDHVVGRHDVRDGHWSHFFLALADGGHLAVVLDVEKGTLAYDLYPFSRELDGAVTASFTRAMPMARTLTFSREAPDLAAPAVAPPRPRR
jgi:hypothetical protein